jgi:hypothetical protein
MAVNATAIWRVRPSGSNNNGGGFDPGIASPGTDYSQQNAAQVTFDGVTVAAHTSGITTTIILTGYTVATTDVGNCLQISGGTNFVTGFYFITTVNTSLNTWTLDRNATSGVGTGMTGRMGGGWADFWTNTSTDYVTTPGPVAGNTIYILGSGTPNSSSYSFDYTAGYQGLGGLISGNATTGGLVTFANDPGTPGYKAPPDTTGGMPCISTSSRFESAGSVNGYRKWAGLYWVLGGLGASANFFMNSLQTYEGCVLDQASYDVNLNNTQPVTVIGCEIFSSVAPGSSGTHYAVGNPAETGLILGCNIHDTVGPGIQASDFGTIANCIVAKCRGNGITVSDGLDGPGAQIVLSNNTIDGNAGNGIEFVTQGVVARTLTFNNIISNHTQAGTYGMTADAGTAAQNDRVKNSSIPTSSTTTRPM